MPLILRIQGACPACRQRSLVADGPASFPGSRIRCSTPMCPDADAAAKALESKSDRPAAGDLMGDYAPRRFSVQTARGTLERLDLGEFISVESLEADGWRRTGEPEFYLDGRRITETEARAIAEAELEAIR